MSPPQDKALSEEKARLRGQLRQRRRALAAALPDHARRLADHVADLDLPRGAVVAGYATLPGEADPAPLLAALRGQGHTILLPRVVAADAPLCFHLHDPGVPLVTGAYGILEPAEMAPRGDPDIVLVPLLAFDAEGRRLGYGGGYYDRTLAALRAGRPVVAVGLAFAGQEVATLPEDRFDQRLDAVLTEQGLRHFARR